MEVSWVETGGRGAGYIGGVHDAMFAFAFAQKLLELTLRQRLRQYGFHDIENAKGLTQRFPSILLTFALCSYGY
jgi:hypothetical protein